jgi:hypothetical protein
MLNGESQKGKEKKVPELNLEVVERYHRQRAG